MAERARKRRMDQEQQLLRKKKKKKRKMIQIGEIICLVILVLCIGYTIVDKILDRNSLGCRTYVAGQNVSWKSPEQAAELVQQAFNNTTVSFDEDGRSVYKTTLAEAGYTLDYALLLSEMQKIMENKESCKGLFESKKNHTIPFRLSENTSAHAQDLNEQKFGGNASRQTSVDARIHFDTDTGKYEILDSAYGTQIDNEKLLRVADKQIKDAINIDLLPETISIPVDHHIYIDPKVRENDDDIIAQRDDYNHKLENYPKTSITYTFGEVTEEIPQEKIQSWVMKDDDGISLDENAIRDYIEQLAIDYDTAYIMREFTNSWGETVYIENNEYGYLIDQDAEFEQLCKDLESGTSVKRDPIYKKEGYNRNGTDDLMGNYVEVCISGQYLWMYQNGDEVTESPVVTGQPSALNPITGAEEDRSTLLGTFPLAYKQSPSKLSSDIYGYDVEVQYWMPFALDQGLHDADWNGSFGGDLYLTAGSHGCVNLPSDQAAVIYNYIDEGYPIIIYQ